MHAVEKEERAHSCKKNLADIRTTLNIAQEANILKLKL